MSTSGHISRVNHFNSYFRPKEHRHASFTARGSTDDGFQHPSVKTQTPVRDRLRSLYKPRHSTETQVVKEVVSKIPQHHLTGQLATFKLTGNRMKLIDVEDLSFLVEETALLGVQSMLARVLAEKLRSHLP